MVSLSFTDNAVCYVSAKRKKYNLEMTDSGSIKLERDCIIDGHMIRPKAVYSAVERLLNGIDIDEVKVTAISPDVRKTTVEAVCTGKKPEADLEKAASAVVPADFVFDYRLTGNRMSDDGSSIYTADVYYADRQLVLGYRNMLAFFGCHHLYMDSFLHCVERFAETEGARGLMLRLRMSRGSAEYSIDKDGVVGEIFSREKLAADEYSRDTMQFYGNISDDVLCAAVTMFGGRGAE